MKWKIKFITCNLLAGLTALMFSACNKQPSIQLLSSKTINFPSASGIEYHKDTLYVFGDDATHLLLLTPNYEQIGSYSYWNSTESVINKAAKPDVESAMIMERMNQPVLIGVGSMSGENRWQVFELPIGSSQLKQTQFFSSETSFRGIEEINIEGSTSFGSRILLSNRANLSTRKNHLLLWNGKDSVIIKEIQLPPAEGVAGMSGLFYITEKDMLLFTASEEATTNAYEDGAIGDSYVGWIDNFSTEWEKNSLKPTGFLKLTSFDKTFMGQKIESICVEKHTGDCYLLHLAADNDNGKTVLFKVELIL